MRDDLGRLSDILEAINKIESKIGNNRADFDSDEMLQVWVLHHLQIIGESTNCLSKELLKQYPKAPWRNIIGMRNILVHQYFEVDLDIVWDAATNELPFLKPQIQNIVDKLQSQ